MCRSTFKTVVTAQQGARNYTLHDVMEPGLVYINNPAETALPNASENYTNLYDDSALMTPRDLNTPASATNANKYDFSTKVYLVRSSTETVEGDEVTTHKVHRILPTQEVSTTNGGTTTTTTYTNWAFNTADDGCDFEIGFKDATVNGEVDTDNKVVFYDSDGKPVDVRDGDRIVVTYWAQLDRTANSQVVVYGREDTPTDSYSTVKDNEATDAWENGVSSANNCPGQIHTESDGNQRNTNSTILTYGAESHTEWDRAEVAVHDLDIVKSTQKSDGLQHLLAGAKFQLYKASTARADQYSESTSSGTTYGIAYNPGSGALSNDQATEDVSGTYYQASQPMSFFKNDPANYAYKGDCSTQAGAQYYDLESDDSGAINIAGIDKGYYLLVETQAPAGYNKLAYPIVIEIAGDDDFDGLNEAGDNDGMIKVHARSNSNEYTAPDAWTGQQATVGDGDTTANELEGKVYRANASEASGTEGEEGYVPAVANGGIDVVNNTGQELPSTGGIGTTIFYVAGTVLVVGAAVMLVAKRRMGAEA